MSSRSVSQRSEQRKLREQMRGMGMVHSEIAAEMARRFALRPRAAWRTAWGWTLEEAAERFTAIRGKNQPDLQSALTGSRLSEWENWPFSTRRPSVTAVFILAEIYQARPADLIDFHDREHLATADLLVIGKHAQVPPGRGDAQEAAGREDTCLLPGPVTAAPDQARPGYDRSRSTGLGSGLSIRNGSRLQRPVPGILLADSTMPSPGQISRVSAFPTVCALDGILQGYIRADQQVGPATLTGPLTGHVPAVERLCEVARGTDRAAVLAFASRFMEFCGWAYQDAGDLVSAMHWTDHGLGYALELGDERIVAYTMMRKASIATESGRPGHGVGMANAALSGWEVLTPRLRAVILRQRALAYAALAETALAVADASAAIAQATEGAGQDQDDLAPFCTSAYVEMEAGAVYVQLGKPAVALPVLETSRATWPGTGQARDYALCVSRLATAYAALREPEQACAAAEAAVTAATGLSSARVIAQLTALARMLGRWERDPATAGTLGRLTAVTGLAEP